MKAQFDCLVPITSIVLVVLILSFLAGCTVKYHELVHEPTRLLLKGIDPSDLETNGEFVSGRALFVPFFNKMSTSYPVPESFIRVYCLQGCVVTVKTAILSSETEDFTMVVDQEIGFTAKPEGYLYGVVRLFDSNSFDVSQLSVGDVYTLRLRVEVDGERDELDFNLVFVQYRDIAWAT